MPLRERHEDILPLVQHFIRRFNEENGREIAEQLAPETLAILEAYLWPGNVRELENVVERAVIIAQGNEITIECLRPEIINQQTYHPATREGSEAASVCRISIAE
ncbi:MAG: hypothetical protein WKF84_26830 [Pyrinomonadaceae bacterium]